MHAKGTFVVQLSAEPPYATEDGITLGRVTLDKTFTGDLVATSHGDMLSARGPVANSAGYVAIERVIGTLGGKPGTFVLQHSGLMDRGGGSLTVTVVPDTGTGELAGLRGKMTIEIVDKQHRYELEYEIT
jgi:uncharacterized protein DUF3224